MRIQTVPTLFDRWLAGSLPLAEATGPVQRPQFDLVEHADRFEIAADLPGFRAEDVEVEYADQALRVSGERAADALAEGARAHLRERGPLRFRRFFALGDAVEVGAIEARFADGVLRISVPKSERARPREIPVTAH